MDRALILTAVLAVTAAFSAWWRARDGRVTQSLGADSATPQRQADAPRDEEPHHAWDGLPVEAADIVSAISPSTPLTLVEFTAPDCAPCEATKRILDDETASRPDVSIAQLDVADALDLARAHRIMRAPTTLLVTEDGHLLGRVSGVPRVDELRRLLDASSERAAMLSSG